MKELFDFILRFGNLNPQQIDFIASKAQETVLPKDEYFSEAGKIARQVGFVVNGIMRVCYYDNKGEEITKYFIEENNLVVDLESFDNEICSAAMFRQLPIVRLLFFREKTGWSFYRLSSDGKPSSIKLFQEH